MLQVFSPYKVVDFRTMEDDRRYVTRRTEDCNVTCNEAKELRELIKQGGLINHRLDELVKDNKAQSDDIKLIAKCGMETRKIVDRYTNFFISLIGISSGLFSFIGWAFIDLELVVNYLELLNASRS